jgi:hypothetical protein
MIRLALLSMLLAAPAIAGDTTQIEAAHADAKLARLTAGRMAGAPVRCIRPEGAVQPETIDRQALAYRAGGTLYVGPLVATGAKAGGCPWLREGRTAVTASLNGQLCRGDVVRIVETGMQLGRCRFDDFTPYTNKK